MALGKTLKALRQKQGLNQKSLSALSGVSQATISRIETGRVRQLRSTALKSLSDALGVSVDFLMGGQEVLVSLAGAPDQEGSSAAREDRLRQIADALEPFALHEDGRFLYVNQALVSLLGFRREELLGKAAMSMITSPAFRALLQRQLGADAAAPFETLLRRRDGTSFPAEIATRPLTDALRISLFRDLSGRRCQQASARLHQAGLQIEDLDGLGQTVRVLTDELEDMGLPSVAVTLHLIDDPGDRLSSFTACPDARGARSFANAVPLKQALDLHPPLRRLVSHWRRDRVWEREPDAEFLQFVRQYTGLGESFSPRLLVDVPFEQGTVSVGLGADQPVRTPDLVTVLRELSLPLAVLLKRLRQVDALLVQLDRARPEARPGDTGLDFCADPDAVQVGQAYYGLAPPQRDLARAFLRRLAERTIAPGRGRVRPSQEKG